MFGNHPSAGVYKYEDDRSARARGISTSIGALVGASKRGKVGERVLVVDNTDFQNKFGTADPSVSFMHHCALAFLTESQQLYVTRVANGALHAGSVVGQQTNLSVERPISAGYETLDEFQFDPTDILYISAHNPGTWGNDLRVVVYPDVNEETGKVFILDVYEGDSTYVAESWRGTLHDGINGYGRQTSIEDVVNGQSNRIYVAINHEHPAFDNQDEPVLINAVSEHRLRFGSDGDPVETSHVLEGWELYEDPETVQVSLLINGGYTDPAVQRYISQMAEDRDDCFAVLDMPSNMQDPQNAVQYRRNDLNVNSSYAALYTPDVLVRDVDNNINIYCPPSGHVAAAYARTDTVAATWFAPAGVNRGQMDILGVRYQYKQGHRDLFDPNQINPIRVMPGRGFVIWGQETLQGHASALSNINVRRLLILLKNSIAQASNTGVYEPNDDILRAELRGIADRFLAPIQRGRGLYGYRVVCDETNNTNEMIANGDVMLEVYIDPVIPAKRIFVRAVVPRTGGIQFAVDIIDN